MPAWTKDLPESACSGAVNWCDTQPDFATAWASCERGDWMLWLVGIQAGPPGDDKRKPLVLATCECARLALGHFPKSEERPRTAIETAEKWARGEDGVTLANCRDAATHAADAYAAHAADAYAAYAATAAYAAAATAAYAAAADAYAAHAADAAAEAADAAACAAEAAACAADAADADASRKQTLRQCADIVRKHYPRFALVTEKCPAPTSQQA